jgi:hypothetical protein
MRILVVEIYVVKLGQNILDVRYVEGFFLLEFAKMADTSFLTEI